VYAAEKALLWVTVGRALDAYVRANSESEYFWGVSYGVVLGNDNRTWSNIRTWRLDGFLRSASVSGDPQFRALYMKSYQAGLVQGMNYGLQMNNAQQKSLNRAIRSKLDMSQYPPLNDRVAWYGRDDLQGRYYGEAATAFKQFLLEHLKNGTRQVFLKAHY
jgi:hypothetical protein